MVLFLFICFVRGCVWVFVCLSVCMSVSMCVCIHVSVLFWYCIHAHGFVQCLIRQCDLDS